MLQAPLHQRERFVRLELKSSERKAGSEGDGEYAMGTQIHRSVRSASLVQFSMSHHIYNLRSGVNNVFTFTGATSGTVTSTVPEGNYDLTALLAVLNADLSPCVFTQSSVTKRITCTNATDATWTFDSVTNAAWSMLFESSAIGSTQTSPAASNIIPDIRPTKYLYICIAESDPSLLLGQGYQRHCMAKIPLDVEFQEIIYYEPRLAAPIHLFERIQSLRIVVCDDTGAVIDNNGGDWNATIQLEYVE